MSAENEVVRRASEYVSALLSTKLPPWAVYHNYTHTEEVVDSCREIAEASKLGKSDLEIALLAAWFHDTGYIETADGHEERSVAIATQFLQGLGYSQSRIEQVGNCILATKIPQRPKSRIEAVVCDADISHIGRKGFFRKSELMKLEWEKRLGKQYSTQEWLNINIEFLSREQFHTEYAKEEFQKRRAKNMAKLQARLHDTVSRDHQDTDKRSLRKEKLAVKALKEQIPERGIETMFRTIPKNHLDLSSMADQKANLMISTNSIIISIVVGLLVSKLDTNPHLVIPTLLLIAVCLVAIIFAILATRPKVTSGTFTKEDIEQKKVNLLFFGNFHKARLEDFEWGMKEMMRDREYLYGSMIKDLYFLGKVLGKKYTFLRISYTVFMYGIVVAVMAFVVAFLLAPPAV